MHISACDLIGATVAVFFIGLGIWGEERKYRWVEWPCKVIVGLLEVIL